MTNANELKEALNRLVNDHYRTPEIVMFNRFPVNLARAGVLMIHRVFYTANRRDCWGSVQSSAPMDVKKLVWAHEQDELISDARFGGDHQTAEVEKAIKLTGLSRDAIMATEAVAGCSAAFAAWVNLSKHSSWIRAFSASAILERANNNRLVEGGGSALRDYQRYTAEVKERIGKVAGHDVHNVADEEHSDMMEVVLDRHAVTPEAARDALEGARQSLVYDRAYRGALAVRLEAIQG
jgi:hypothetical protein